MTTVKTNPFRSPVSNARYTQALFLEQSYEDRSKVIYTLKDEDHDGFPSLYRLYLEAKDPTEIKFANSYLDGWDHWTRLCQLDWFKPFVKRWREELELHLKAQALKNILDIAKDQKHPSSFAANKLILSGEWKPEKTAKVGRPSKEAIKKEAEALFNNEKQAEEDLKRLQGTIN